MDMFILFWANMATPTIEEGMHIASFVANVLG